MKGVYSSRTLIYIAKQAVKNHPGIVAKILADQPPKKKHEGLDKIKEYFQLYLNSIGLQAEDIKPLSREHSEIKKVFICVMCRRFEDVYRFKMTIAEVVKLKPSQITRIREEVNVWYDTDDIFKAKVNEFIKILQKNEYCTA